MKHSALLTVDKIFDTKSLDELNTVQRELINFPIPIRTVLMELDALQYVKLKRDVPVDEVKKQNYLNQLKELLGGGGQ